MAANIYDSRHGSRPYGVVLRFSFKIEKRIPVPSISKIQRLMVRVRDEVVHFLRDYTRERVRDRSLGAGNTGLEGYSDNPVTIDYPGPLKRKRKPVGGAPTADGMYFQGGYKQYRRKAGLNAERFQFFNTGDAWRDWKILRYGSGARSESQIGFSDNANAIAAAEAEIKRPLLFSVDMSEASMVNEQIVDLINSTFLPA